MTKPSLVIAHRILGQSQKAYNHVSPGHPNSWVQVLAFNIAIARYAALAHERLDEFDDAIAAGFADAMQTIREAVEAREDD